MLYSSQLKSTFHPKSYFPDHFCNWLAEWLLKPANCSQVQFRTWALTEAKSHHALIRLRSAPPPGCAIAACHLVLPDCQARLCLESTPHLPLPWMCNCTLPSCSTRLLSFGYAWNLLQTPCLSCHMCPKVLPYLSCSSPPNLQACSSPPNSHACLSPPNLHACSSPPARSHQHAHSTYWTRPLTFPTFGLDSVTCYEGVDMQLPLYAWLMKHLHGYETTKNLDVSVLSLDQKSLMYK
jgi:hypothetical protein